MNKIKEFFKKIVEFFSNPVQKQIKQTAPQLHPDTNPGPMPVVIDDKPEYYKWAEKEIGVTEKNHASRVIFYLQKWTKLAEKYWKTSTSWCAAFVSAALGETGYRSLKTSWARDYMKYAKHLPVPVKYCLMGFERNGPGGDSHVGIWTGRETATHYEILGGNQNNQVCYAWYKKSDLLYAVMPEKLAA